MTMEALKGLNNMKSKGYIIMVDVPIPGWPGESTCLAFDGVIYESKQLAQKEIDRAIESGQLPAEWNSYIKEKE